MFKPNNPLLDKKRILLDDTSKFLTPTLVLCFDRPDNLKILLTTLKKYNITNIYISQDGCKNLNLEAKKRHAEVRQLISNIKWTKNVKKNFFKNNLGKQIAPPKGISWFFKNTDKGIILEDDTIPSKTFFKFCEQLLKLHEKDKNIFQICGSGTLSKNFGAITYLSSIPWMHGWATWKDRWKKYNYKINDIKKIKKNKNFLKNVPLFFGRLYWLSLFKEFKQVKHKTWDYTIVHDCLIKDKKCIKPSINMITNIGYTDKNVLSKRKRYEFKSFEHLKNKKDDYMLERNHEGWILYNLSLRYRLSLLIKYILNII